MVKDCVTNKSIRLPEVAQVDIRMVIGLKKYISV